MRRRGNAIWLCVCVSFSRDDATRRLRGEGIKHAGWADGDKERPPTRGGTSGGAAAVTREELKGRAGLKRKGLLLWRETLNKRWLKRGTLPYRKSRNSHSVFDLICSISAVSVIYD